MQTGLNGSLLASVRKPSTYLGNEINTIRKDPASVDLLMALCFPDLYEIGTSHFGLQILYHILNRNKKIAAERIFSPGPDMEALLRTTGRSAFSLESQRPLEMFDIIGFSLLYELNYTNILTLLDLSGIPFYAADRKAAHPLVIAGGPCTVNPEPVADFFDAMVIGDGERVAEEMCRAWLEIKKSSGTVDRAEILDRWSSIEGVYVPSLFTATYDAAGFQRLTPVKKDYTRVTRAVVPHLTAEDFPNTPVVPYGKPVHDRLRLEIARGCTRGCRFCQAGMIYRPVRERPADDLLALAGQALAATGYEDLSLLSLSTGDYSRLHHLLERMLSVHGKDNVAVSVPSFRAGSLGQEEMDLIRSVRKTGFTIAPEAGTQRLRDVINKNITEEEIVHTVSDAFGLGWNLIKTYFMVGLPTETDADIDGIVSLVSRLARIKAPGGRGKKLHVSVAAFIPKSHTPFQWEPQVSVARAKELIFSLKRRLESGKVGFKWQHPETSLLEGLFARGDRRLSALIEAAWRRGCRFDGWSDSFDFAAWQAAAEACALDMEACATRKRETAEPLPWDHVFTGVSKAFLEKERDSAYGARLTPDCRDQACSGCGVCDFESVEPRLSPAPAPAPVREGLVVGGRNRATNLSPVCLEVSYSKTEEARFFGHLEFIGILSRAIRRARVPVVFSHGFHPKPKLSFSDPLPVGVESECERFWMTVYGPADPEAIRQALNRCLPDGFFLHECRMAASRKDKSSGRTGPAVYNITVNQDLFDAGRVTHGSLEPGPFVITVLDPRNLVLEIRERRQGLSSPGRIVASVFGVDEALIVQGRVVKRAGL